MNTIADYVNQHVDASEAGIPEKVTRLRTRAAIHQSESARLVSVGDARQAELHAGIARTHLRSAQNMEQESIEAAN
jgi:predicted metalloprotease